MLPVIIRDGRVVVAAAGAHEHGDDAVPYRAQARVRLVIHKWPPPAIVSPEMGETAANGIVDNRTPL